MTCSARPRRAASPACGCCGCCADEDLIGQAREEATALVAADPDLAAHPALREAIAELLGVQAEYLDKT